MAKMLKQYELRQEIGRGGMATVYLAYDTNLEREVALKALPAYFSHEPQFTARFRREAKTISALEHTAIVPIYDYGEVEQVAFLVMRLMTGGSLGDRLRRKQVSLSDTAIILTRIAGALDKAHRQGIIHRDLKPDNILFDEDGAAYLADFGIVKLAESSTTYTQTGGTLGTPAYMSPEQAQGLRQVDYRSDIYSLGVLLFRMLAGRLPYEADTGVGLAMKHVLEPIPDIRAAQSDLPPGTQAIINRAMAKEPTARYPSAGAMAQAVWSLAQAPATSVAAAAQQTADMDTVLDTGTIETAVVPERQPATPPIRRNTPKRGPAQSQRPGRAYEATPIARTPAPPAATPSEGRWNRLMQPRVYAVVGVLALLVTIVAIAGALIIAARQQPDERVEATAPAGLDAAPIAVTESTVATDDVTARERATLAPTPTLRQWMVMETSRTVPLRLAAAAEAGLVRIVSAGESIRILGITEGGDWYKVATDDEAAGWLPADAATATEATIETETPTMRSPELVTIDAGQSWQSAGIRVTEGDRLTIVTTGSWRWMNAAGFSDSDYNVVTADGLAADIAIVNGDSYFTTECPRGSLIATLAPDILCIGAAFAGVVPRSGVITFRINDDNLDNNSGSLSLHITLEAQE